MNKEKGFTLLEMMIVVAVVGIVVGLAYPTGREFLANRRTSGQSRQIYNALNHAKMQSIKDNSDVELVFRYEGSDLVSPNPSDPGPYEFDEIDMLRFGTLSRTQVFKASTHVNCKTPRMAMRFNSRGLLNFGNGTIEVEYFEPTISGRIYKVISSNLGVIRRDS